MNIRDHFSNKTPNEIKKFNKRQIQEHKEYYNDFINALILDCCSLCGNRLNYFNENEKCFHWFLKPEGIKKKHFKDFLKEPIGFYKLDSYFRWLASTEQPMKNINDLSYEISESKIVERTFKYQNFEWSLTYGEGDLNGHPDKFADFPHFHLQMLENKLPFIAFGNYHIPFSKEDLFYIQLKNEASDLIETKQLYGQGMSFIENEENLEILDKNMVLVDDPKNASLMTTSFIKLSNGEKLSEELLLKIFKESKISKIPVRHIFKKYFPNADVTIQVSPGEGVPVMKKRNKR